MLAFFVRFCGEPPLILQRLLQCIFVWGRPASKGNPQKAQLIVVQTASDCEGGVASVTNIALADLAERYHKKFGTPIFPQAEAERILQGRGVVSVGTTLIYSTVPLLSEKYGNGSLGIAESQQQFCAERGWTKVLVLAYYPHAWRVIWIYERMGLEVIIPKDLPKMHPQANMSQWRHRRAVTSYLFELAARLFFLYKGYI